MADGAVAAGVSGTEVEHFDAVIVGAGLSGIGVARYLKKRLPKKRFVILEDKASMGGTWELFKYPGIRSDSDMHTMGYAFKPWKHVKAIAEGGTILGYIKETARENDLEKHIRYRQRVLAADWSSETAAWTLTVKSHDGGTRQITCDFYFSCTGYYSHDEGYLPEWPGYADFQGTYVHPQFWPADLDYAGKTVLIVGSGATAVTLSPTLAQKAAKVVQLQRSPTYVVSRPSEDQLGNTLKKWLPAPMAYHAIRWRNILRGRIMGKRMAKDIKATKKMLVGLAAHQAGCDPKHFNPSYFPGQQRICLVPDGDMFRSIKAGQVEMVTDEIERFDARGVVLKSGERIDADIIVTATGLVLQCMGGVAVSVDGQAVDPAKLLIFKGFMYSNLPNLIYFTGYTNASWTLKVDLVADFACRLLKHMDRIGAKQVTPVAGDELWGAPVKPNPFISGYVKRAAHRLPRHGGGFPWLHEQNYFWDRKTLLRGRVDDGSLTFSGPRRIELPPSQRIEPAPALQAAE